MDEEEIETLNGLIEYLLEEQDMERSEEAERLGKLVADLQD